MSAHLHEFIADVREAESPEEERLIIKTELADIRTMIRDCDVDSKPKLISKLVYLNIAGENVSWGQIESVALMSNERLSYKRTGYLAAQTLLDEASDVAVLLTQTVLQDLRSSNPLFSALALSFIANKGSADLCEAAASDVEKLTGSIHPGIEKRAGAAAVTIIRKLPELAPTFKKALTRLLSSTKHGVVSSGVLLAMEMIKVDPTLNNSWKHFAKPFTQLLKVLSLSKPTPEFRLGIFHDPFLQIKTMQLLGLLGQQSDELDDVLTSLVTAIDTRRNTGRALLFQTVETIGKTANKPSLAGLALNQIGRLLNIREPNVLYSALSAFARLLYDGAEVIGRSSRESLALKRYKSQVVHCLDHRDPSIRRRALDVVLALIDESNVESLVPEVIDYLHLADRDFRTEMVAKVYAAVQRFAPSQIWHFDMVHLLLIDSGSYAGSDLIANVCRLISTDEPVRNHALPLLANTISGYSSNQSLVRVAAFALGEFSIDNFSNGQQSSTEGGNTVLDVLIKILKMPQTQTETKCYVMTAAAKIAARTNRVQLVIDEFLGMASDNDIEVQQRAGELVNLLNRPDLWDSTLAPPNYSPLPARSQSSKTQNNDGQQNETKASIVVDNQDSAILDVTEIAQNAQQHLIQSQIQQQQQQPSSSAIDDLLDLDFSTSTNANTSVNNAPVGSGGGISLGQELLGEAPGAFKPPPGAVEALRTADFAIYFEIQRNASNPRQLAVRSSIANLGTSPLTQFSIQYGVPAGWIVRCQQPLKNAVLQARGGPPLQQVLFLENRGNARLMMKTHTTYMYGAQPLTSDDALNPVFD
ncbi:AP-1 complex subunit gamma [Tritrichomonas foetus]|uniref:AP-1 complex subunit gamma n=1 Tax=Tritrichomonas foetus TaxID=1144522 RepID=A0A1J4JSX1_9EUKA|nr:AP-1 complex subunit gamma [Tritrichomonas foetus]|eukprot:OHT02223.1 AP-1 complex subunit gamma [Tritrichomonas foetus]